MALSGVRSSWLMLDTNCDLCSLANWSWRFLSWISSNSRTFSIAMAAWSAKVLTNSICLSVNGRTSKRVTNGKGALGHDDIDVGIDQRHRKFRKSRDPTVAPLRDENVISSLHVVFLGQSTQKGLQVAFGRRCCAQISDAPYALRLLRARRERPRSHRTAEQRDEV